MTKPDVLARAQTILNYRFQDPALLEAALTHSSAATHRLSSNERLEFLGDSILGLVVCEQLYRRFPESLEGEMTKIKSAVVSRKACAEVAGELGLGDLLFLGKGMSERNNLPMSLHAAVTEAIVGAIYLDGGLEAARHWVLTQLNPHIDQAADSENQQNYKSYLQQYAQREMDSTPLYEALDEQGPDHSKCFEICVSIGDRRFPSAWGTSKKEAEQKAALRALRELQVVSESEPD